MLTICGIIPKNGMKRGCIMFKDKIAVITGGARGIGRCIVEEFISAGAKVAVIDRLSCEANLFFSGDIAEEAALEDFSKQVIDRFGRIDFLINNACLSRRGILSGCSYEDFLYVQKVGVVAPYLLTKLFSPHFNEGGAVVNISSTRAFQSQPDTESYTAAKGGITALTHGLAVSLGGKVRVNCISPGWVDTTDSEFVGADNGQHPAGRVGKPVDIAKMVLFLCSENAGFITGENITIDGGMSKLMVYHNDNGWKLDNNS